MTVIYVPARRRSLAFRILDALPDILGLGTPTIPPVRRRFAPPVVIERERRPGRFPHPAEAFADPLI